MTDMHQIENKMRALKLSGMVETLDMRLRPGTKRRAKFYPVSGGTTGRRGTAPGKQETRQPDYPGSLEEEKSLEGFDFNFNPKLPAQYIRELATCQFIERKESVILCGPVGVGKHICLRLWDIKPVELVITSSLSRPVVSCLIWEAAGLMKAGEEIAILPETQLANTGRFCHEGIYQDPGGRPL